MKFSLLQKRNDEPARCRILYDLSVDVGVILGGKQPDGDGDVDLLKAGIPRSIGVDEGRRIRKARRYLGQRLIGLESASAFQEGKTRKWVVPRDRYFVPLLKETTAMGLFVAVRKRKAGSKDEKRSELMDL